jgi:hypothetical protein
LSSYGWGVRFLTPCKSGEKSKLFKKFANLGKRSQQSYRKPIIGVIMKHLLITLLALSSISAFAQSSIVLNNKNGEKIAEIECVGGKTEEALPQVNDILKGKTVKNIVSTSEVIKIKLNDNRDADGSLLDSIELDKAELNSNGIKCKMTVEL